ncbi:MAG: hypothetical protein ACLQQ4_08435 [Bacteroidia bacterium]
MKKTMDFLYRLSNVPLDIANNKVFIERSIQLIECRETLSPEEKKQLNNLKLLLNGKRNNG